jgi:hypothetical protein
LVSLSRLKFTLIALALLITILGVAGCGRPDATPTPMIVLPTVTPTLRPPIPTPTPLPPSAREALASARAAVAELKAYRFSLSTKQTDVAQMEVTGIWTAPGFYDAVVSLPLCPPDVPGAPAPTSCLLLPIYREISLEGGAYSRAEAHSGGGWTPGSLLSFYDYGFVKEGVSPAQQLLSRVNLHEDVFVSEIAVGTALAYQVISRSAQGETTSIRIDRQSNQLLSVAITGNRLQEEWTFSSHDEPLAVARPVPDTAANPVDWLDRKVVRLVEDDLSFPSRQLRPFSARDEPIVTTLINAISGGRTAPITGVRPQGRELTIHFTDGTFFALAQAFSDDTGGRLADSWYIQGASSVVLRAAELSDWWFSIDDYFTPVSTVVWPDSVTTGKIVRFSGRGWPDEVVILSAVLNERKFEFGEARTAMGAWVWEGFMPVAVQPGTLQVTVRGKIPGVFVHKPESHEIAVGWPDGFAIKSGQARVVYATGASEFPVGMPLWSGKIEHRKAVQELVAIVNDAPGSVALGSKVDRSSTLHIVHPDGTEALFNFAGDCGVFTKASVCSDNRWAIAHVDQSGKHLSPETYIDSPNLSAWWHQADVQATAMEPLRVPEQTGSSLSISGEGWVTGETVSIVITMNESELLSTHADLRFGEFSVEVQHLALHSGRLVVAIIGQGLNPLSVTQSTEYQ